MTPGGATNRLADRWRTLPAVAYMGLIFFVSSLSLQQARLPRNSDKLIHFAEYGVLAALWTFALRGGPRPIAPRRAALWSWAIAAVYGATDELHQLFVPHRSCSVYDWIADTLGAALAASLLVLVWKKKESLGGDDPPVSRQDA